MKPIVFSSANSLIAQVSESVSLRIGYILADEIASAGGTMIDLFFSENFQHLQFRQKMIVFEAIHKSEEEKQVVQDLKAALKIQHKIKHKTPQQIVAQKKMEQTVHNICMETINGFDEMMRLSGLMEMRKLADEAALTAFTMTGNQEEDTENRTQASKLLQRLLPEMEGGHDLFFLGAEFNAEDFKETYTSYTAAQDIQNVFLESCLTFPNINLLSALELKAVRKQLDIPGIAFRKCADTWVRMCYDDIPVEERITFFKNKLLPAATLLQQTINENDLLMHCSSLQNDGIRIKLFFGEIPVELLWEYYKHFKVIGDETCSILEAAKAGGSIAGKRWPVMLLMPPEQGSETVFSLNGEDEKMPLKKSIAVD
ncbi:MAG TPA: hypothetical protein PLP23_06745 [Panacibacter sp.]|nr:hypothetical protein [Panacibacter sp.]